MKLTCKELREMMLHEWQRFTTYTVKEVESYIRHNYESSDYAVKKLAREFAGR